jgi:FkbM family methyltransferase
MIFRAVNAVLKKYTPGLQRSLKRGIDEAGFPLPKMLWGRPVWTHPRLWNHVVWDEKVLNWITEYLKPGDIFFDVGAHQGWLSVAAARRTGSAGRVVAFEPSPILAESLLYHKRFNRLSHMEIVPKAVTRTDSAATSFILEGDGDSVLNSLVEIEEVKNGPRGSTVIPVEAITLDSYSQQTGHVPDVVKIDTEGSEIWVCEGAEKLLTQHKPVLIIATHPAWLPAGQNIQDLFDLLSAYGYRVVDSDALQYGKGQFGDYLLLPETFNVERH